MVDVQKIVEGCRTGDKKAQYRLYDPYSPKLFAICLRYTEHRDDAHDVLQEAFIRIFDKIAQVREPMQLEGWLRRVTVSTAINHYHRAKKHRQTHDLETVMFKVADETPDVLSSLNSRELLMLVSTLPQGYRIVFNMFVIEGYSHKEIAEMLDISEGTSKSQLNHAKTWLKNSLMRDQKKTTGNVPPASERGDEEHLLPAVNK